MRKLNIIKPSLKKFYQNYEIFTNNDSYQYFDANVKNKNKNKLIKA